MMEKQIKRLLSKYYLGETTLEEERRIKRLLKEVDGFEEEKMFFLGLEEWGRDEPRKKPVPGFARDLVVWQKAAAIAVVFLALGWLALEQQKRVQEEEAYDKVVEALALIQKNMKKGTSSLKVMQEIKYLSTTNELFNIKEIKEEEK